MKSTLISQARAALAGQTNLLQERDNALAQVATLTGERDTALADVQRLSVENTSLLQQVEQLKKSQEDFDRRVSDMVTERIASLGVPAENLPAAEMTGTGSSATELRKEFAAITDPAQRADFYKKHRDKMLG